MGDQSVIDESINDHGISHQFVVVGDHSVNDQPVILQPLVKDSVNDQLVIEQAINDQVVRGQLLATQVGRKMAKSIVE